jgi:uncharacterized protein YjbI with pentapeptide repeats
MAEDFKFKNDDGGELGEEESKEVKRLEVKKKVGQKEVLGYKDQIFSVALVASDFTKANLSGVNFENANLIDVRMLAVNLSAIINLNSE